MSSGPEKSNWPIGIQRFRFVPEGAGFGFGAGFCFLLLADGRRVIVAVVGRRQLGGYLEVVRSVGHRGAGGVGSVARARWCSGRCSGSDTLVGQTKSTGQPRPTNQVYFSAKARVP